MTRPFLLKFSNFYWGPNLACKVLEEVELQNNDKVQFYKIPQKIEKDI